MFKKPIAISYAILAPLIAIWIYQIAFARKSDITQFREMVEHKQIASSNSLCPTNQHRKQVRKDIWFSQDDCSRLHYQITSEGSTLTLTPIKNKFEVVEKLDKIKCWMQDKLICDDLGDNPSQQARLIEAADGIYRHTTQEFTANGVALSLFRLPGHQLPTETIDNNEAFLRGVARNVSFLFSGKAPQFQADQFEATMVKE